MRGPPARKSKEFENRGRKRNTTCRHHEPTVLAGRKFAHSYLYIPSSLINFLLACISALSSCQGLNSRKNLLGVA